MLYWDLIDQYQSPKILYNIYLTTHQESCSYASSTPSKDAKMPNYKFNNFFIYIHIPKSCTMNCSISTKLRRTETDALRKQTDARAFPHTI